LIAILDYGFGNVRSAQRAFARHGVPAEITSDKNECINAQGLVIPGVGAFAACMDGLDRVGAAAIVDARLISNRPILGICVGMQVLFTTGIEHGITRTGLSQWPGTVNQLGAKVLPHMGWSEVEPARGSTLFQGVENERFYFVHSYATQQWELPDSESMAPAQVSWSEYGSRFIAGVENGPLSATQFHPEKSGDAGATLIENWISTCR
jgi:glutamine amidotransferase